MASTSAPGRPAAPFKTASARWWAIDRSSAGSSSPSASTTAALRRRCSAPLAKRETEARNHAIVPAVPVSPGAGTSNRSSDRTARTSPYRDAIHPSPSVARENGKGTCGLPRRGARARPPKSLPLICEGYARVISVSTDVWPISVPRRPSDDRRRRVGPLMRPKSCRRSARNRSPRRRCWTSRSGRRGRRPERAWASSRQ